MSQQGIDTNTAPFAAFVLRLSLGIVFLAHAWLKIGVLGMSAAADFFVAQGFPAWTVYPVAAAELVGGLLLVGGVYSRWVALALLPVIAGAFSVHGPNGWYFASPDGGWEYIAFLTAALLVQAGLGNGRYAMATLRGN